MGFNSGFKGLIYTYFTHTHTHILYIYIYSFPDVSSRRLYLQFDGTLLYSHSNARRRQQGIVTYFLRFFTQMCPTNSSHILCTDLILLPNILSLLLYQNQPVAQYLKFILFWNNTLHVSDGLSVRHQESKTVHTASYHTGSVAA